MKNYKNILLKLSSTIKEALDIINKGSMRIALVVKDSKLLGIISNFSTRRAIVKKRISHLMTKDTAIKKFKGKKMLATTINKNDLLFYLKNQLNVLFLDNNLVKTECLAKYIDDVLFRLNFCFKNINRPYYNFKDKLIFNHLHSDHYSMLLYIFSNTIWKVDKNETLASKIFLLNKALHGIDAFYSINLPEIFVFVHPIGTILGNAKYGNYFAVYQNCTIGSTDIGKYPSFSEETLIYSNSSILGNCKIGKNVVFAANSSLINTDVGDDKVVLDSYPNNKIINNKRDVIDRIFK